MSQIFLTAAANHVLSDLITHLPKPPSEYKVAFIPTAAEVEEGELLWLKADKDALISQGFDVEEFTITNLTSLEIEGKLANKNLIFMTGGNSFYLLDQIIKTGFDEILKRKLNEGVVYIGSSAGSMVMGKRVDLVKTIDDASKAPDLKSNGLEIVDCALLPHWGDTHFFKGYYLGFEAMYNEHLKMIPLSNSQYLWFNDGQLNYIDVK
jgi:dipeptidase E